MIVVGIDPSLRNTGYALLEKVGSKVKVLHFGHIPNAQRLSPSKCLKNIYERVSDVLEKYSPAEAAMEDVIYVQSFKTAITLGSARGVIQLALEQRGIEVSTYPAKSVKKSMTGWGSAKKEQVGFMVRAMFGLTTTPTSDEADAIAIANTHLLNVFDSRKL